MKVKEFLSYQSMVKNLSPLTVRNYKNHIKEFVIFLGGSKDIDEVDYNDIVNFQLFLRERGLSPSSCNMYLQSLRCYYDYCVRFQGMPSNPACRVEKMRTPKLLPKYVQEYKMNMLFDKYLVGNSFKCMRSRAVIAFFYMTGARCAEVSRMSVSDIDFNENRIYLFGKGSKQRIVPMCSRLRRILLEYLECRNREFGRESSALFVSVREGERLSDWEIRIIVRTALLNVVPANFAHPHILRHTFATVLMNHGKAIQDISRWLGHTSIAVTQRYLTICANPSIDNFESVF